MEAAKGKAANRAGNAAAAGDDATHNGGDGAKDISDNDEDASSDVLPLASAAAARPRRSSHWAVDPSRTEELEDCVLELQAEVARLTEQVMHSCKSITMCPAPGWPHVPRVHEHIQSALHVPISCLTS